MKKIILCAVFTAIATISFSQDDAASSLIRVLDSVVSSQKDLIAAIKKVKKDPQYAKQKKTYYDYVFLQYDAMDGALDDFAKEIIKIDSAKSIEGVYEYIENQREKVANLQKAIKRLCDGLKISPIALKPLLIAYKKEDGLDFLN